LRWAVNLVAPLTRVRIPPIIVHLPAISEPASDVKSRGPLPSLCTRLGRRSANGSFRRPLRLPNDASSRDRRRMNVLHASVEPPHAFAGLTEAGDAARGQGSTVNGIRRDRCRGHSVTFCGSVAAPRSHGFAAPVQVGGCQGLGELAEVLSHVLPRWGSGEVEHCVERLRLFLTKEPTRGPRLPASMVRGIARLPMLPDSISPAP
jgi:hypothetical protein